MAVKIMQKSTLSLLAGTALLLAGCASEGTSKLPGVYRIDIQQGNVVEQDMLDQLEPGMDKNQVRFILGTPIIVDPFHQDRWEYIYTYSEGGKQREQRRITVFFENNRLQAVGGDVMVGTRPEEATLKEPSRTVEVPLKDDDGVIKNMIEALPFVGDDGPKPRREPEE